MGDSRGSFGEFYPGGGYDVSVPCEDSGAVVDIEARNRLNAINLGANAISELGALYQAGEVAEQGDDLLEVLQDA